MSFSFKSTTRTTLNLKTRFKSAIKSKYTILLLAAIVVPILYFFILPKLRREKVEINEHLENFKIEVKGGMNREHVQIKWYRADVSGVFKDSLTFQNELKFAVPHATGENCFAIFYKNKPVKFFGHYVYSEKYQNNYRVKLWIKNKNINCSVAIEGPDSNTTKEWAEMFNLSYTKWHPESKGSPLPFNSDSPKIKNTLDFTLSQNDFKRLVANWVDTCIEKLPVKLNGLTYQVSKLKTRGQGSLYFPRKCYNVTMKEKISFMGNDKKTIKFKTFSLISLSMDNYYYRNRIALDLLKKLNAINTYYSFIEVRINEKSQGVYLLIENPKKHLTVSLKSPFILRRGYENSSFYEVSFKSKVKSYIKELIGRETKSYKYDYEASKKISTDEEAAYVRQYNSIYKLIKKEKGVELYESLKNILDIRGYMRLMAFNYIICNHDYTDEQFLYINGLSDKKIFHIFPWDFDDVFSNSPHEGWQERNILLKDKLIFSGEDYLDLAIANDPVLYGHYLNQLDAVLKKLSEADLKEYYQNIYKELYAFYSRKDIMAMSKYDQFETEYNLSDFQKQLNGNYLFLSQRMETLKSRVAEALQETVGYSGKI